MDLGREDFDIFLYKSKDLDKGGVKEKEAFEPEKRGIVEPGVTEVKGKVIYKGKKINEELANNGMIIMQTLRNIRIDAPS